VTVVRPAVALLACCGLLLLVPGAMPGFDGATRSASGARRAVASALVVETGGLQVGTTLAQRAADAWESPSAVGRARSFLRAHPMDENQSIMGWGVGNPEPSPGVYDWSGLDRRLAEVAATGGTPVVTLAGAPDWMAGHPAGETDWARLGEAPTPAHYEDFAHLAAAVARRYPQVHHFQVWNELDGFWDATTRTWDIAAYTRMYDDVYRAVKAVDPDDEVGGPYVVMDSFARAAQAPGSVISGPWGAVDPRATSALLWWLDHCVGADFVAVDADSAPTYGAPAGAVPPEAGADRGRSSTGTPSAVADTAKFAAVDDWLRSRTHLPIWWSEFYVQPTGSRWDPAQQAAVLTVAMARMASSGASVALLWGAEADGQGPVLGYLWSSCTTAAGGRPSPLAASIASFDASRRRRRPILVDDGEAGRWRHGSTAIDLSAWQVVYLGAA
jgi:hypothetical protein